MDIKENTMEIMDSSRKALLTLQMRQQRQPLRLLRLISAAQSEEFQ